MESHMELCPREFADLSMTYLIITFFLNKKQKFYRKVLSRFAINFDLNLKF